MTHGRNARMTSTRAARAGSRRLTSRHDGTRGTIEYDGSVCQLYDVIGAVGDFRPRVGDVDRRNRVIGPHAIEVRQDLSRCARSIDASGSSSSSSCGCASSARPSATRCFSPPDSRVGRRASRPPRFSSVDDLVGRQMPPADLPAEPAAEQQVLADGQVRKQPRLLEHVADPALVRRPPDAASSCRRARRRRDARRRDRAAARRR